MSAMSEQQLTDDQSHYEVSLTAGQAFVAFVFLLLSLAASFAFGLMIGRQSDERPVTVKEASAARQKVASAPAEVAIAEEEFKEPAPRVEAATVPPASIVEEPAVAAPEPAAAIKGTDVPHHVQVLSSSDQKAAEALAARLIEAGFNSAYVERGATDKGPVFRVRVKYPSEQDARAAAEKLRQYSKDVWVTRQ